jgi:hypothetical protein
VLLGFAVWVVPGSRDLNHEATNCFGSVLAGSKMRYEPDAEGHRYRHSDHRLRDHHRRVQWPPPQRKPRQSADNRSKRDGLLKCREFNYGCVERSGIEPPGIVRGRRHDDNSRCNDTHSNNTQSNNACSDDGSGRAGRNQVGDGEAHYPSAALGEADCTSQAAGTSGQGIRLGRTRRHELPDLPRGQLLAR